MSKPWMLLACSLAVCTVGSSAAWAIEGSAFDTVVVRPAAWAGAIAPWKAYRESQGHRIAELDSHPDNQVLRTAIARIAAAQTLPLRFVLLAGDVTANRESTVPTFYHDSTAMRQFGGDPKLASDNPYGDLNDDFSPELAVGRIPADSAEQLQSVLSRVMAYEQQPSFSTWRRDVHVVAGVGGFGAMADSVIEMTTRRFLADRIPGWSELSLTQASVKSHYCPDPWRFSEACIERMNQGGMFWVYIGHGHVKTLDYVRANDEWLPILNHEHVRAIDVGSHPPIAVFLACYTGAFDAIEDSLAEELILSKSGPIAALAASRVSGPYGLAMLSDGLLSHCFDEQIASLGEIILRAKQALLTQPQASEAETPSTQLQMIGAIASALSPAGYDLLAERREHVWEMNLLGDPLMRMSHPQKIPLQIGARATAGEPLTVAGKSPMQGKLSIEFAYRREHVRRELDAIQVGLSSLSGRDAYQVRYQSANERILVAESRPVAANEDFSLELQLPESLPRGKYAVRAFLEGSGQWGAGYSEISVRPAE